MAWLHNFRRIVTRWEVKVQNYLGFVHLGCIRILLRQPVFLDGRWNGRASTVIKPRAIGIRSHTVL